MEVLVEDDPLTLMRPELDARGDSGIEHSSLEWSAESLPLEGQLPRPPLRFACERPEAALVRSGTPEPAQNPRADTRGPLVVLDRPELDPGTHRSTRSARSLSS